MPEHEHFTLSELQNSPKKKGKRCSYLNFGFYFPFFFSSVPTPTPITTASYVLLTVSLFIECINSPLSFANKVICLLDPDHTFKYSSFIWIFLLRYMGQVFRAVEQFPFDLFSSDQPIHLQLSWGVLRSSSQLRHMTFPWSVQMTHYRQEIHLGISQWLINIHSAKFTYNTSQQKTFGWTMIFFWVAVIMGYYPDQFLVEAQHIVTEC